jgi:hypothetical protein
MVFNSSIPPDGAKTVPRLALKKWWPICPNDPTSPSEENLSNQGACLGSGH